MASEYRNYLAASILNEDRVITYRLLSRALKVHVNTAKEMLFDFHRLQNGKKPGSVHATYLVAGRKYKHMREATKITVSSLKDGEDEYMQSSPFKSSPMLQTDEDFEDSPVLSVALIREEDLKDLRSQYDLVTSIHVYSIGPYRLKDLQSLSDVTREISETYSSQDPLKTASIYGTISGKDVRRRSPRGLSIPVADTSVPVMPSCSMPKILDASNGQNVPHSSTKLSNLKSTIGSSQSARDLSVKGLVDKKLNNNSDSQSKRGSSNIFKSFAKAAPKLKREDTGSSVAGSEMDSAAPSGQEDEPMKNAPEDEEDDYVAPLQPSRGAPGADGKSRKEREAALKRMMEDNSPEVESEVVKELVEPEISTPGNALDQLMEDAVQAIGGRRRGRRRVMKKKTIMDEEGYLVTKEELVWESFSEDEPMALKSKAISSFSSSSAKVKKGSSKPGQGNIMSFFGKK